MRTRVVINTLESGLSDSGRHCYNLHWLSTILPVLEANYGFDFVFANEHTELEPADVLWLQYRWPMGRPDRDNAYFRQQRLIAEAKKLDCRIVCRDDDHKANLPELLSQGIKVYGAELRARPGVIPLFFPPVWSDVQLPEAPLREKSGLTYIGNDYERLESMKLYLGDMALDVFGNWGTEALAQLPGARLRGRCDSKEVLSLLNNATCTVHFAKPSYYERGWIAPRWREALQARCPAAVPAEFDGEITRHFPLSTVYSETNLKDFAYLCSTDEQFVTDVLDEHTRFLTDLVGGVHLHWAHPWACMLDPTSPATEEPQTR